VSFVVTCEHGGNRIPRAYAALFRDRRRMLESHRGYDPGALVMAHELARALRAALIASTVSRLLVELNRSPLHRALYSATMRDAPERVRRDVYRRYYVPYRSAVERAVRAAIERGHRVVHISAHSFAPVVRGVRRHADAGLLYDPRRSAERRLCLRWQQALRALSPRMRVRRNHPYRGASDGLTTWLRGRFGGSQYIGIELEINQRRVRAPTWPRTRALVVDALRVALGAA